MLALLGELIIDAVWSLITGMILAAGMLLMVDHTILVVLPGVLLVAWNTRDMYKTLAKMREQANRDTVRGLNGPVRQEDLL